MKTKAIAGIGIDLAGVSDETLLEAARSGSPDAFNALVHRHFGVVYAIGLARLNDCGHAEDLAQEVFVRLYLLVDRLRGTLVSHWLARVARNLAVDWQRRDRRAARLVPMIPLEEISDNAVDAKAVNARERAMATEKLAALHVVMGELEPEQRELVLLHFMEGLTHRDIAQRFGVNKSTVSRQIAHALKSARSLMDNQLRQMAAGLCAKPPLEQRTIAVCAAVLALSAETRRSTAMLAAESLKAGSATVASHGPVAAIKTLIFGLKTGGITMASTKTVLAVGAAIALFAGGYYYYEHGDDLRRRVDDARRQRDDARRQQEDVRRQQDELRRQREQAARTAGTKP